MPYLEGETDVGMIWNGEAVMGRDTLDSLEYVYPEEGIIAWLDSFVIPKNAKNPEAAHQFISFVLQPEISALISEEIATPHPTWRPGICWMTPLRTTGPATPPTPPT